MSFAKKDTDDIKLEKVPISFVPFKMYNKRLRFAKLLIVPWEGDKVCLLQSGLENGLMSFATVLTKMQKYINVSEAANQIIIMSNL